MGSAEPVSRASFVFDRLWTFTEGAAFGGASLVQIRLDYVSTLGVRQAGRLYCSHVGRPQASESDSISGTGNISL